MALGVLPVPREDLNIVRHQFVEWITALGCTIRGHSTAMAQSHYLIKLYKLSPEFAGHFIEWTGCVKAQGRGVCLRKLKYKYLRSSNIICIKLSSVAKFSTLPLEAKWHPMAYKVIELFKEMCRDMKKHLQFNQTVIADSLNSTKHCITLKNGCVLEMKIELDLNWLIGARKSSSSFHTWLMENMC